MRLSHAIYGGLFIMAIVLMIVGAIAALFGLGGSTAFEFSVGDAKVKTPQTGLAILAVGAILSVIILVRLPKLAPEPPPDDHKHAEVMMDARRVGRREVPRLVQFAKSPLGLLVVLVFSLIAIVAAALLGVSFF